MRTPEFILTGAPLDAAAGRTSGVPLLAVSSIPMRECIFRGGAGEPWPTAARRRVRWGLSANECADHKHDER